MLAPSPDCWTMAQRLLLLLLLLASEATAQLPMAAARRGPIAFDEFTLVGEFSDMPTSLQFGPDDRLYVGQQDGRVRVYQVVRIEREEITYEVTSTEALEAVYLLPNHDDDGALNPSVVGRQLTGLTVAGTPEQPVVFLTSSDPRIGGGTSGTDTGLDTNSGVLSVLVWVGVDRDDPSGFWRHLQLVRGLPRSEENHGANGLVLDAQRGFLYWCQGGHTNMGAPSNNFTHTPEYALSGAVLRLDLKHPAIDLVTLIASAGQLLEGHVVFDLPTLDRGEDGLADAGDPFGGDDGTNQAVLSTSGPVEVYATGLRNAYDLVLGPAGRLYTVDNGPNAGWGGPPAACGTAPNELDAATFGDGLHLIGNVSKDPPRTFYGGHPNPVRAGSLIGGQDPVPSALEDPRECYFQRPHGEAGSMPFPHDAEDDSLWVFPTSSNGLARYDASVFGKRMRGDLLVARHGGTVDRIVLTPNGTEVAAVTTLLTPKGRPLDVTAQGDDDLFPGTIWVADHLSGDVKVYEPNENFVCLGHDDPGLDEDGDGFSNTDELLNGTDPCSAASSPPDFDGDLVSDRLDADDDGDGIFDLDDNFVRDPANGLATKLPLEFSWALGDPGHGLFGLGFTGLMRNGSSDYMDLYDAGQLTPGGASGVFTIDVATKGTAEGTSNDQDNGFQLGVPVDQDTRPLLVSATLVAPWFDGVVPPADGYEAGVFVGTGDQSDFALLRLVSARGTARLELVVEAKDVPTTSSFSVPGLLAASQVDLRLVVEPVAGTVQPLARIEGGGYVVLAQPVLLPEAVRVRLSSPEALAVGILCTSAEAPGTAAFHFDHLAVREAPVAHRINVGGPALESDDGNDWDQDTHWEPSPYHNHVSTAWASAGSIPGPSVPPSVPAALFVYERWDPIALDEMRWSFPVGAERLVLVRLLFGERYSGNPSVGDRVFSVKVEGLLAAPFDDVDLVDRFGYGVGGLLQRAVLVGPDGVLNLDFLHVVENPKLDGIEVLLLD